MAKVISFVSRKGGTGKTTNAINIATTLTDMGKKVVLIETDINYTLNALREEEFKGRSKPPNAVPDLIATEETSVVREIKSYQKEGQYDIIVVDSAGNTSEYGTNRLCVHSDLVIVPTSLSVNDLMVAKQTIGDILPAMEENPVLKLVILPVRIHSRTKIETVHDALSHLETDVLDTYIPARKLYTRVSTVQPIEGYEDVTNRILKLL